jgi:hypothetical protein
MAIKKPMNLSRYLPIIVAITSAGLLVQICLLVALFVKVRQSATRMQALASEVKAKVMPIAEMAKAAVAELTPRFSTMAANISETTNMVRGQIERVDAAVIDTVDRSHLQVIRAEDLLDRTRSHIGEASDLIQRMALPVRRFSGLAHGVMAGFEFLLRRQRRRG